MFKLFKKILNFFKTIIIINKYTIKNFKIVFYSENKNYQKYSSVLIEFLSSKYPNEILYVSSDKDDVVQNKNVTNLYIGNSYLLNFFFLRVKADNLFTTTTDLGNNIINKTNNVKNYIYYFHSPVSTTRVYTTKAFDNYDVIMCIGEFQINEIERREKLKKIKEKRLIKSGYFYFDYLKNNLSVNSINDEYLVAPSWNYKEKQFINEDFEIIIESLLKYGFKVRFRPHPEHFKRSIHFIENISKKFSFNNFILDKNIENIKSMDKAKCLITDNSGIAVEFSLILKKPVFYYLSLDKVHNDEAFDYHDMFNLEDKVKKMFGYSFTKEEIKNLNSFIDKNTKDFYNNKLLNIDNFINQNFYNYKKTKFFLNNNIKMFLN